jgi:predicted alpha/beta superfamily hydrolase
VKKRTLSALCGGLSLALLLTACGGNGSTSAGNNAENSSNPTQSDTTTPAATEYQWDFQKKNAGIDDLKTPCDQQGTVVSLEYDTPAYAINEVLGVEETIHKTLYVYLPYGYDENQQYNILYLMHGGGESEAYWLMDERWGETTRNTLDNMIKNGVCDPFIVVTPTFYSLSDQYEITDEQAAAYAEEQGDEQLSSPYSIMTVAFGQELRNNIIPAVEAAYSTYAGGDVSEENLIATRDHRAFAGFSMGSMTSIRSALMQDLDLISWVGSYSGSLTTVDQFKAALESDALKDYPINFWYNGNGKGDIALEEHDEFAHGVLEAMPDRFTDGENFAWINLKDGAHMYASWLVDLYNCMLVFFR